MSRRVFTKFMEGIAVDTGTAWTEESAITSWLAQEDIEVIGFQLGARAYLSDQNDDLAEIVGELSQAGLMHQDGLIGRCTGAHYWNTVPQSVDRECDSPVVMFPEGLAVPVKEEGYLYLHAATKGAVGTHMTWKVWAIVYYTKRGG
ncbi:hypothetical protein ES708_24068 [subsurface metagenome]